MQSRLTPVSHEIGGAGLRRTGNPQHSAAVGRAAESRPGGAASAGETHRLAEMGVVSRADEGMALGAGQESVLVTSTRVTPADVGLFILRATLAAVFIFHGGQKLFGIFGGGGLSATAEAMAGLGLPLPFVSAVLAGAAEFFGGLALLLGLWPRIAAIPLIFTMIVAIVSAHWGKFSAQAGGMEYPLTLAAALLAIALIGGGRIGVAALLRRVG